MTTSKMQHQKYAPLIILLIASFLGGYFIYGTTSEHVSTCDDFCLTALKLIKEKAETEMNNEGLRHLVAESKSDLSKCLTTRMDPKDCALPITEMNAHGGGKWVSRWCSCPGPIGSPCLDKPKKVWFEIVYVMGGAKEPGPLSVKRSKRKQLRFCTSGKSKPLKE